MIVKDLIEAQVLTRDSDGFTAERVFIIDEITGQPETRLYNAIQSSGIPAFGDPHPTIPDIQVTEIQANPATSGSQIKINVVYSVPDNSDGSTDNSSGSITVNSSLITEEVFEDINGDTLKADYKIFVDSTNTNVTVSTKYATVDVQRPQMVVTFRRLEDQVPKTVINDFLGVVNSTDWSGFPAHTWLCTNITVSPNKDKFDVDYSFAFNQQSWQVEVIVPLTDTQANNFPIDKATGNGYSVYDVYKSRNFNELGLSF